MGKSLLLNKENHKCHFVALLLILFTFQKAASATYYVNDNNIKGDIYTTAVGNDNNDGLSAANPKLTVAVAYEQAKDGDTIIIDTGSYKDLSEKGELLFAITKKITFTIAGVSDMVFSKTPLPTNIKVNPAEIYIDKDQPIDRETYLQKQRNRKSTKSQ